MFRNVGDWTAVPFTPEVTMEAMTLTDESVRNPKLDSLETDGAQGLCGGDAVTTKPMCAKHRAEFDDWTDRGPHRPLPRGVSTATMFSQAKSIREICASGRRCSDSAGEAFS